MTGVSAANWTGGVDRLLNLLTRDYPCRCQCPAKEVASPVDSVSPEVATEYNPAALGIRLSLGAVDMHSQPEESSCRKPSKRVNRAINQKVAQV